MSAFAKVFLVGSFFNFIIVYIFRFLVVGEVHYISLAFLRLKTMGIVGNFLSF